MPMLSMVGHPSSGPAAPHLGCPSKRVSPNPTREDGGLRHLEAAQINEVRAFVDLMTELTPDGQTTRYPMTGIDDLGATWCCLNSSGLRDAVYAFLARLEPR